MLTANQFRATVTYSRGNARFGRTTALVSKATGQPVFEAMDILTRAVLFREYLKHLARVAAGLARVEADTRRRAAR